MGLFIIFLWPLLKVVDYFLYRRLHLLPEVERRLAAGEYGPLEAARAQYFLDYCVRRGLYAKKDELSGGEKP